MGLELERQGWIYLGRDVVGQRTRVSVTRNRFGPPGRRVELEIRYADEGDRTRGVGQLLDAGPPGAPAVASRPIERVHRSPPDPETTERCDSSTSPGPTCRSASNGPPSRSPASWSCWAGVPRRQGRSSTAVPLRTVRACDGGWAAGGGRQLCRPHPGPDAAPSRHVGRRGRPGRHPGQRGVAARGWPHLRSRITTDRRPTLPCPRRPRITTSVAGPTSWGGGVDRDEAAGRRITTRVAGPTSWDSVGGVRWMGRVFLSRRRR